MLVLAEGVPREMQIQSAGVVGKTPKTPPGFQKYTSSEHGEMIVGCSATSAGVGAVLVRVIVF